jgi:hypothetical protein
VSGCTHTVTVTVTKTLGPVTTHQVPAHVAPSPPVPVVNDCTGTTVTEPRTYPLACADYGIVLLRLRWSSWTATGAEATGRLGVNDCQPNCAAGKFGYTHAAVSLSGPVSRGGRVYFTHLKVIDPAAPPGMTLTWTVGAHGPGT